MRPRAPGRGGFSLVEMLAVLAILALVAGVATQLTRRPSPHLRVESAARSLCAALRTTRMRALAAGEEMALTIDLRRKAFVSPAVAETALPADARIEVAVADGARRGGAAAGVSFYPTGGSSGAGVRIAIEGASADVDVNWLTGATRCAVH
jgi:general secretion pathway protein H